VSGKNVFGLLETIVSNTGNTVRVIALLVVGVGVIALALWWLNADLRVGEVGVTRHETSAPSSTAPCDDAGAMMPGITSCTSREVSTDTHR
jgi:hypothetical protein